MNIDITTTQNNFKPVKVALILHSEEEVGELLEDLQDVIGDLGEGRLLRYLATRLREELSI